VVHSGKIASGNPEKAEHEGLSAQTGYFVESYIPVREAGSGKVLGVMEFYKIPTQLNAAIREGLLQLWLACAACALALFAALFWIVARADRVLKLQHARLAEGQALSSVVELAGAVAHNLRNPLASIRVSAEMLQQSDNPSPETGEHCKDITASVDRADRWISELVRVSQAPQLIHEPVQLQALILNCLQEISPELQRRRILWQTPALGNATVMAHPAMLRQIVLSIMANAIDAMPTGGELSTSLRTQASHHILSISDTGHGVSDEVRQRLFRPFFSTKSGGLGIGLALVKRMVNQWGGDVTLTPNPTQGTRLDISLPRADEAHP
jgi:two-component system sensor histidine kinase HydH